MVLVLLFWKAFESLRASVASEDKGCTGGLQRLPLRSAKAFLYSAQATSECFGLANDHSRRRMIRNRSHARHVPEVERWAKHLRWRSEVSPNAGCLYYLHTLVQMAFADLGLWWPAALGMGTRWQGIQGVGSFSRTSFRGGNFENQLCRLPLEQGSLGFRQHRVTGISRRRLRGVARSSLEDSSHEGCCG